MGQIIEILQGDEEKTGKKFRCVCLHQGTECSVN